MSACKDLSQQDVCELLVIIPNSQQSTTNNFSLSDTLKSEAMLSVPMCDSSLEHMYKLFV